MRWRVIAALLVFLPHREQVPYEVNVAMRNILILRRELAREQLHLRVFLRLL